MGRPHRPTIFTRATVRRRGSEATPTPNGGNADAPSAPGPRSGTAGSAYRPWPSRRREDGTAEAHRGTLQLVWSGNRVVLALMVRAGSTRVHWGAMKLDPRPAETVRCRLQAPNDAAGGCANRLLCIFDVDVVDSVFARDAYLTNQQPRRPQTGAGWSGRRRPQPQQRATRPIRLPAV